MLLFSFFPLALLLAIIKKPAIYCESITSDSPKVTLSHGGIVVGSYMKSLNGNSIHAFRGIPYAEPPIGNLRFKAPLPAKPWSGEKLTNQDGNICPSQNPFLRVFETVGDEDCLYINVYTPAVKTNNTALSVMVWIHGGGFMTGSGSSTDFGPERLLDFDIILVTGNYRLGALGFLSTGTEECPGNFGFKDQALMLEWVRDNIGGFGGNPNDVTIFGVSAGGGSVGFHVFSPRSKGLFQKAILQSGTNFDEWAVVDKAVAQERALKLGQILNCPTSEANWKALIDCLRGKSAKDIASVLREYFEFDTEPCMIFTGVVEPSLEGAFLTKDPRETDIAPSAHVPIMIGITNDEGLIKSGALINLMNEELVSKFTSVLPILLRFDRKPEHIQKELIQRIDEFYFKGKHDWSKQTHHNLTNLFSDNWFVWGQDKFLRNRFAASGTGNSTIGHTFVYIFDQKGTKSFSELLRGGPEYYGVSHGDDMPYLFHYPYFDADNSENEKKMKMAIPLMWTNFAKTGNPTPDGGEIPKWIPADKFPLNYAHIGRQTDVDWIVLSNEQGLLEERMQFWRDLEELY